MKIILILFLFMLQISYAFALAPTTQIVAILDELDDSTTVYYPDVVENWANDMEFSCFVVAKRNPPQQKIFRYLLFKLYKIDNEDFYLQGKKELKIGEVINGKLIERNSYMTKRCKKIYINFCAITKTILEKEFRFSKLRGKDLLIEFIENLDCPARFIKNNLIIQINPLFLENESINNFNTYLILHELLRALHIYKEISDLDFARLELEIYKKVTNDNEFILLKKDLLYLYNNNFLSNKLKEKRFDFSNVIDSYQQELFDVNVKEYINLAKQA